MALHAIESFKDYARKLRQVRFPLRALLESPDLRLDGFIGPGHVCTVVGARPFEFIPADYGKPIVISGFEPLDLLHGIWMTVAADVSAAKPWTGCSFTIF